MREVEGESTRCECKLLRRLVVGPFFLLPTRTERDFLVIAITYQNASPAFVRAG